MFRESFNWFFETLFHNHILLYMTSIEIYTSKISEILELNCHISHILKWSMQFMHSTNKFTIDSFGSIRISIITGRRSNTSYD